MTWSPTAIESDKPSRHVISYWSIIIANCLGRIVIERRNSLTSYPVYVVSYRQWPTDHSSKWLHFRANSLDRTTLQELTDNAHTINKNLTNPRNCLVVSIVYRAHETTQNIFEINVTKRRKSMRKTDWATAIIIIISLFWKHRTRQSENTEKQYEQ